MCGFNRGQPAAGGSAARVADNLPAFELPGGAPVPVSNPPQDNFNAANTAMKLTPEEQALYQRHLTNAWGPGGVDNPDGSRSTLYQVGFTHGDGRTYNVPTVYDGKIISPDSAISRAISGGIQRFPSYQSPFEAENRYQRMHGYMERDVGMRR